MMFPLASPFRQVFRILALCAIATVCTTLSGLAQTQPSTKPRILDTVTPKSGYRHLALSHDGKYLYVLFSNSIEIFKFTGDEYTYLRSTPIDYVSLDRKTIRLTSDGTRLIGSSYRQVCEISLKQADNPFVKRLHDIEDRKRIENMRLSASGNQMAGYGYTPSVHVSSLGDSEVKSIEGLWPDRILDVHLSAEGGQLLVLQKGRVTLFDVASKRPLQMIESDQISDNEARFELNGTSVLSRTNSSPTRFTLYNLLTGDSETRVTSDSRNVMLSRDGQWLFSLGSNTIMIHGMANEEFHAIPLKEKYYNIEMVAMGANRIAFGYSSLPIVIIEYPESAKSDNAKRSAEEGSPFEESAGA